MTSTLDLRCSHLETSIVNYLSKISQILIDPPRNYLIDYIESIKRQVNSRADEVLRNSNVNAQEVNRSRQFMLDALDSFENECLRNLDLSNLKQNLHSKLLDFYQIHSAKFNFIQQTNEINNNQGGHATEAKLYALNQLENNIVQELTNYKRVLFSDKLVCFMPSSSSEFGKLVFKKGIPNERVFQVLSERHYFENIFETFEGQVNDKHSLIDWSLNKTKIVKSISGAIAEIDLEDLYTLKELSMQECYCKLLSPFMFFGLECLESLDLSKSYTIAISKMAFLGLKNLKYLNLSWNRLDKIEANYFRELENLEVLVLSENQINQIDKEAFNGLHNLKKLFLDNNRLKRLERETFSGMDNLEHLSLESNRLKQINDIDLNKLTKLKVLNLNFNEIDFILPGTWSSMSKLQELYLKKNGLKFLSYHSFIGLNNLQILDLSHNYIESFDKGTFGTMKKLKALFLNHNSVSIIDERLYDDLDQLDDLYL